MMGQPNRSESRAQDREILPKRMQDLMQYAQEGQFETWIKSLTVGFQGNVGMCGSQ